ncbi:MAG: DTW domain-containing protein [Gammaproteobacteria bacterium]|nr:DTW domain-containing protein [Gammaproteobacteria bacterium]
MQQTVTCCARCTKPPALCICDRVEPVDTALRIVVLQHPQEDDAVLGTAPLLHLALPNSAIHVGLSWASLDHALGVEGADRDRWAVLAGAKLPAPLPPERSGDPVVLMDRKGRLRDLARHGLDGIIVLDGSWSQAKTLWWRNAWMLRLPRLLLTPREPSMYGKLRRAPRREWVSTLEAVCEVLPALGESADAREKPRRLMRTLLQRARDSRRH